MQYWFKKHTFVTYRELHLENINVYNITLWKEREAFIFRRSDDESAYESDGESMIMTPEGIIFLDRNRLVLWQTLHGRK